jgi:lipid-A-disaccharide synthase-like uncharacterized protein
MLDPVTPLFAQAVLEPGAGMDTHLGVFLGITWTPWKIVGIFGNFLFAARWIVQFLASRAARKVVMPKTFWYLSLAGAGLCLAYFVWGKNDAVGVLAYLFPTFVAAYNLVLQYRHEARGEGVDGATH